MSPEVKAALRTVLDHVEEYEFLDDGRERNVCPSCGWDSVKDRTPNLGLSHKQGCKLRAALDLLEPLAGC